MERAMERASLPSELLVGNVINSFTCLGILGTDEMERLMHELIYPNDKITLKKEQ
jgi:hypothetical protein